MTASLRPGRVSRPRPNGVIAPTARRPGDRADTNRPDQAADSSAKPPTTGNRALAPLAELVWLVLDDVHELGSDEARRQLELLVMRGPPELRLVLATRHDTPGRTFLTRWIEARCHRV
jgi:hypothetical protein